MIIFPAIDLVEHQAVRLFKGDYAKMTVYSENPSEVAMDFVKNGAPHIHIVDLEGAKTGTTPNFETVVKIKEASGAFCEIGGGIRDIAVIKKYMDAGLDRVIIGTAAVKDPGFLNEAVERYGEAIAVGVDIKDGFVAINGWTEQTQETVFDFSRKLQDIGVKTLICTDISKDGAMRGTNRELYRTLQDELNLNIVASGGISSMDDIRYLRNLDLYGAIVGKAYYTGSVNLREAVEVSK